jgi:hypothetical protein
MVLLFWGVFAVYFAVEAYLFVQEQCDVGEVCPMCECTIGECVGHQKGFCPLCRTEASLKVKSG